jgi:hypothetical protein
MTFTGRNIKAERIDVMRRKAYNVIPTGMVISPDAIGLSFFRGCILSDCRSSRSFMT